MAGSSQITAWQTTAQTDNVYDSFASAVYNSNAGGTVNWVGNWVESDATQNAAAGNVLITGGELRLGSTSNIYRQVDLSDPSITSATLTFDYRTVNLDNGDTTLIEVCISPTGACTTVLTFTNDQSGTVTNWAIPANRRTATTTLRFRATGYNGTNEYLYINTVNISYAHLVSNLVTGPGRQLS